jgi:hypothetical protein
MTHTITSTQGDIPAVAEPERARRWLVMSIAAATLGLVASLVALGYSRIYEALTPAFLPQAIAQDIANLVIFPLLVACAILALRGSLRAYLVWLGVVAFTVYSYVIYAFSVPFGRLFPAWVTVLGLCLFALIGALRAIDARAVAARFTSSRIITVSAWFLLVIAGMFALLWLSEDVPALLAGSTPQSALDMALPTNPVHVLDYAFFLPAAIVTGIGLLRRDAVARVTAPAFLVLLALTCAPILITPLVHPAVGSIPMVAAIGMLAVALVAVLVLLLRSVSPRSSSRPQVPPQ